MILTHLIAFFFGGASEPVAARLPEISHAVVADLTPVRRVVDLTPARIVADLTPRRTVEVL